MSGNDPTPYVELAKHHKRHTLDLTAALWLGCVGAAHRRRVAARLRVVGAPLDHSAHAGMCLAAACFVVADRDNHRKQAQVPA